MRDLAPEIHRQRLVIEGLVAAPIDPVDIVVYLTELGAVTDMTVLTEPITHRSPLFGWAGWVHWESSGAHFYAWDVPRLFFSVDIYTCKPFDPRAAVDYTRRHFQASDVESRGF